MWAYFDSTLLSSACCPSPSRPTRPTCPTRPIGGSGASPGRCHQCRQSRSLEPPVRPAPRRQRRGLLRLSDLLRDSSNRAHPPTNSPVRCRRQMKCAAGGGGDGDRIGGEWVGCPFGIVANPTSQTLSLVPGTSSPPHGGFMPGISAVISRASNGFIRGLYPICGKFLYVSPGCGQCAWLPVRFFDPSELTLFVLARE